MAAEDAAPRRRPVPRKAGINNFAWDLRYPGAKGFQGMILWSGGRGGAVAVPGHYTVRLTVNGQTLTERLNLEKDPRIDAVTIADLTEQFKLAMQIRDKTTEANEMVIAIRELKKQMDDRLKQNSDAALKTAFEAFGKKLSAVEEEVYQVRNRSDQDPLNFPIKLNNKLAALERVVESGDGRPNASSYTVFKELSDQEAALKAKLDAAAEDGPAGGEQAARGPQSESSGSDHNRIETVWSRINENPRDLLALPGNGSARGMGRRHRAPARLFVRQVAHRARMGGKVPRHPRSRGPARLHAATRRAAASRRVALR